MYTGQSSSQVSRRSIRVSWRDVGVTGQPGDQGGGFAESAPVGVDIDKSRRPAV